MKTTPFDGDMSSSAAFEQGRLEQSENQAALPETPATADGHDEGTPHGDPPAGTPVQEIDGDNETASQENPGDVDQNGEGEESSQDDTQPATSEDAGQGDDGASQDSLGLTEAETKEVESESEKIKGMTLKEVVDEILETRKEAREFSDAEMLSCSKRNVKYACRIGNLFVRAKSVHKAAKTNYTDWLTKEFVEPKDESGNPKVMSVRTAQRYVQLANRCKDQAGFINEVKGLRDAYQKAGIIQPFDAKEASSRGGKNEKRSDLESLMKGLLDSQNILRNLVPKVCVKVESAPDEDQRLQIVACRDEINGFVDKINGFISKLLGETVGETEPGDTEPGKELPVGKHEEGTGEGPPSDSPDPGVSAKSKVVSTTHIAMGKAEPDSKKAASSKPKSGKSQTPATASK